MRWTFFATAALAVLLASPALAQATTSNANRAQSGANVNVQGDTYYQSGKTKSRVASTASGIAPGLTAAGVHSCAGSASIGVGGVGWNFGAGTTYEMQECNRRAYAATLMGMGQNAAALALVCNNPEVQTALNQTGVICPQQAAVQQTQAQAAGQASAYSGDGSGNSAGTRYIPANGRGGDQLIPLSAGTQARYASTTGSIGSASQSAPPFCQNSRTYNAALCAGVGAPQ